MNNFKHARGSCMVMGTVAGAAGHLVLVTDFAVLKPHLSCRHACTQERVDSRPCTSCRTQIECTMIRPRVANKHWFNLTPGVICRFLHGGKEI